MAQYIDKSAVIAEIERNLRICAIMISQHQDENCVELYKQKAEVYKGMRSFLDTLEINKAGLESEQRMRECPYRQVGCTMYADRILECTGACNWVVDYLNLKKLKAQKGE